MNIADGKRGIAMKTENDLLKVFEENGIFIDDKNVLLQEYIPDSLTFVSIVISIEEEFDIELPDDLLLIDHLGTFNSLWERIYFDFLKDSTSNDS